MPASPAGRRSSRSWRRPSGRSRRQLTGASFLLAWAGLEAAMLSPSCGLFAQNEGSRLPPRKGRVCHPRPPPVDHGPHAPSGGPGQPLWVPVYRPRTLLAPRRGVPEGLRHAFELPLPRLCSGSFCRMHQVVASKVRHSLRLLVQRSSVPLNLDHGNPTIDNIAADFDRFGFNLLMAAKAHPSFVIRREHLRQLNKWRNAVAHHRPAPVGSRR